MGVSRARWCTDRARLTRIAIHGNLCGIAPQLLVHPALDLTRERRTLTPARWILPLAEPLEPAGAALVAGTGRGEPSVSVKRGGYGGSKSEPKSHRANLLSYFALAASRAEADLVGLDGPI